MGADGVDQADARRLAQHRARSPPGLGERSCCSRRASTTAICEANLPLSASMRGEIGPDGVPHGLVGRIVAETGFISDADDADGRIDIDHAEFKLNWDAANRVLSVPFQIISGGNRITLLGQVEAPRAGRRHLAVQDRRRHRRAQFAAARPASRWCSTASPSAASSIRPSKRFVRRRRRHRQHRGRRRHVRQGRIFRRRSAAGRRLCRHAHVGRCAQAHVAGFRRAESARLVQRRISSAARVERIVIAVNAPLEHAEGQRPAGARRRPVDRRAGDQLRGPAGAGPAGAARCRPQRAHRRPQCRRSRSDKAIADMPSGRKLVMSAGVFEVPDTAPHEPPARVHFKLDGPVPAAAELLRMDRLRDAVAGAPFDPATTRGTMSAQVDARHAAQGRSAAGLDQLRHHGRCHEFFRRPHDHGPEGRGRGAAR